MTAAAPIPLRAADRNIFTEVRSIRRELGELPVNSDQVFEMTFLTGHIQPNHAAILLLFFHAIERERLEAMEITGLGELPLAERAAFKFLIPAGADSDDDSTAEMRDVPARALSRLAFGCRVCYWMCDLMMSDCKKRSCQCRPYRRYPTKIDAGVRSKTGR